MYKRTSAFITTAYLLLAIALTACNADGQPPLDTSGASTAQQIPDAPVSASAQIEVRQELIAEESPATTALRDSTPVCLVPEAPGTAEIRNEVAVIDASHCDCGYIMAAYTGSVSKIKLRITGPDKVVYTYDLHRDGYETFPLSSGDGSYEITIYENISGTSYSTCLYGVVEVSLADEFSPFLYPNQYVCFDADSRAVAKGAELSEGAQTDLDVIIRVYNYITSSITYDYEKASNPPTGYTTDVDAILDSGTGICLDYAALMAAMLRSQSIPTRLEVGYAKEAYHAWISVYTEETGWLNGLIEFDADSWTLVDPTFGANSSESALKKFIGDGSNYTLQKLY